jgi:hypothetical protein
MDINGTGGGNTDQGEPVYSSSDGIVAIPTYQAHGYGNHVLVSNNGSPALAVHLV